MSQLLQYIQKEQKVLLSFVLGLALVLVSASLYQLFISSTPDVYAEIAQCESFTNETQRIDCWYSVMRDVHNNHGTAAAFEVFNQLYENKPLFVRTGCHLHAHRIGDFSYYDSYLTKQDLDEISFPQGSQVCGYGFYHGFFEHLIQDNPQPEYVNELCNYMDDRLGDRMPGMRITCYHGSGHGFTLAEIDEGDLDHWGDYNGIIAEPLELCEALGASENEEEECRQGVFNVLVLWMESGEYGLEYDWEDPFWLCRDQEEKNKNSCYYEIGQKMDRVTNWDLDTALAIINDVPDQQFAGMLLSLTLASYLQTTITSDEQFTYMERCANVREELQQNCIGGIIGGLMEHGNPGEEHTKVIEVCSVPYLSDEQRSMCFESLKNRLQKFNSNEKIKQMCTEIDNEHFKRACENYNLENSSF